MSGDTVESTIPKLLAFRHERDWEQFHSPKNLATAITIEASELLEKFLWRDNENIENITSDSNRLDSIREEVADILRRYGRGTGHIFNLGHGITPDVDPEHAKAFIEAVVELSPEYHR